MMKSRRKALALEAQMRNPVEAIDLLRLLAEQSERYHDVEPELRPAPFDPALDCCPSRYKPYRLGLGSVRA